MSVTCKECGKNYPNTKRLSNHHIKNSHGMSHVQYELKHGQYSNLDTNERPVIPEEQRITCKECNFEFKNCLTHAHLIHHGMTVSDYKKKYGEESAYSEYERDRRSEKMAGENNPHYGKRHSEETKQKISSIFKEQFASGRVNPQKGKTLSEETKQKSSKTKKARFASGETVPWAKGKTGIFTDETRKRISDGVKKYAIENKEEMKMRTAKAHLTKKERYGEHYRTEQQKMMITHITEEGRQKATDTLIGANKKKSITAKANLMDKMKSYGYKVINFDGMYIEYECTNGKFHSNRKNYFDDCRHGDQTECKMCLSSDYTSIGEHEVLKFIKDDISSYVSQSNWNIISPYEIDIYLPEHKVGVEFNGLFWHSNTVKEDHYHLMKHKKCVKAGVNVIQIFEDEWYTNPEAVKSLIKSNCEVYDVVCEVSDLVHEVPTDEEYNSFIKTNNIYNESVEYETAHVLKNDADDIIMSVAGKKMSDDTLHISDVTYKNHHKVDGGFASLIGHLLSHFMEVTIVTYHSDMRLGNHSYLSEVGFKEDGTIKPMKWQYKNAGQKESLIKIKSEDTIDEFLGKKGIAYYVVDCGQQKWILK